MPFVALPVYSSKCPLDPDDVVPDVNDSMPLVPTVPAFSVRTTTAPDVSAVPSPVVREIAPPVKEPLYPADPDNGALQLRPHRPRALGTRMTVA